jgi:hypothetical protein
MLEGSATESFWETYLRVGFKFKITIFANVKDRVYVVLRPSHRKRTEVAIMIVQVKVQQFVQTTWRTRSGSQGDKSDTHSDNLYPKSWRQVCPAAQTNIEFHSFFFFENEHCMGNAGKLGPRDRLPPSKKTSFIDS